MKPIIKVNSHFSYSGLLNSNYQKIVNCNFKNKKSNTLFGLKQRLKAQQLKTCSGIETALKISLFLIGFIIALN